MRRLVALLLLSATPAFAQSSGLEEQLRSRLREVTAQLAQAQADAAPLKARVQVAEHERDALKAELARAKPAAVGTSAAEKRRMASLEAELAAARAKAAIGLNAAAAATSQADVIAAHARQESTALRAECDAARATEVQHAEAAKTSGVLLAAAEAKNARLYALGKDILERYRRVGFGDVLVSREPFIGRTRVRLENDAEKFGDQLYENKFDPRVDAPQPAPAAPIPKP